MAGRQLQLARRENFFSDPFFSDFMSMDDDEFSRKMASFKEKSSTMALASNKQEAAHNLQVSASNDKFMIQLELPGFLPEDFSLKTKDDVIQLEAVHQANADGEATSRKFVREFKMPEGVLADQIASSYSSDGILTIQAPRVISAPEGATVQEAMAAASKAYTTDDGKTAVKQDSSSASQLIAATTESPDGSTKSSMTFASSSSSSSSMVTSSSGPMTMSLGGGPAGGALEMDDMMKKMMEGMKLGGGSLLEGSSSLMKGSSMSSKMSSFSSSSMTSSSSTSMSSSSTMGRLGGGLPGMPQLSDLGGGFPKFDIEELSTAGTDFMGPPSYTVQSPRASVDNTAAGTADFIRHTVKPTADFKPSTAAGQADHTVLLKLRQGDEYKLVLNMQQYSPENITVKLNGNELTVTASAGGASASGADDFRQVHTIPDGIDLDQLSSSFSADGVLVVKAPRKK